ncbi:Conserved_hypothetical protein [Hexamita inflata]|uniref:Uncharacterized protein n=1 Tax=Hexamita inflata TaxID=28002 RepID=A0AA86PD05_9EUKA|nr:Conserved hypothetical protein [Hexamita inflata]
MERSSPIIAIQDQQDQYDIQQTKEIKYDRISGLRFSQLEPKPIEESKKNAFGVQIHYRENPNIAKVIDEPEYVYLSRFSPLCKCVKYTILLYLCVAAITAAMLSINIHMCGLDASTHTLRMRMVTYPITATGLTSTQNADQVYKTYDNLEDTVRFFDFNQSIFENDPDAHFVLIDNTTEINIDEFPLALVFNFTYAPEIAISSLSFTDMPYDELVTEDDGAAFKIQIDNPKRTRMQLSEPWFNFDYWYNVNQRYNYVSQGDSSQPGPYQSWMCGTNFKYRNDPGQWYLADSRDRFSQIPLWFVDMRALTQADVNCAGDYGITFKLDSSFCFSPLLVRQVPNMIVNFSSIELNSDIIIDFDTTINSAQIGYRFSYSKIDCIWLTKASSDETIYMDFQYSNVSFYIPKDKNSKISFFAQSGNKSTPEIPMELYQTEFQIYNKVGSGTILVFEPVEDESLILETVTESSYTYYVIKIGRNNITIFFEDYTVLTLEKIGAWQVKIKN